MRRLYFAYGSNLSPRQMRQRCPDATRAGKATLYGWQFFATARGSAGIRPCRHGTQSVVEGGLWWVSPRCVATLDLYEGVAVGNYVRRTVTVIDADGNLARALTYVPVRRHASHARVNYMLTAVLPGASAFDLSAAYVAELQRWLPARPIGERQRIYRGRKVRGRRVTGPERCR